MSTPDEIQDIIHEMSNEVAGAFYPTDPAHLKRTIDTYLRESRIVEIGGKLRALMVPHAGYVFSGTIAATGYRLIRNLDQQKTWRIILLGLSHFKPRTVAFQAVQRNKHRGVWPLRHTVGTCIGFTSCENSA
jgi:AmmeMemoRadiSam system protein B